MVPVTFKAIALLYSKRWILHDNNLCLGHCLQTRRQTLLQKKFTVFYLHQGHQRVCTSSLHVCCILHNSLAFMHLKSVRLTFWQNKPFVCALLHSKNTDKKTLDTEFSAKMPASATRWIIFFCYIFVRLPRVGPVLSDFRLWLMCIFIF